MCDVNEKKNQFDRETFACSSLWTISNMEKYLNCVCKYSTVVTQKCSNQLQLEKTQFFRAFTLKSSHKNSQVVPINNMLWKKHNISRASRQDVQTDEFLRIQRNIAKRARETKRIFHHFIGHTVLHVLNLVFIFSF